MRITIPIEPVSQLRPRATNRGGHTRVYDPPKVKAYKDNVRKLLEDYPIKKFSDVELDVKAKFYLPVQKSISKKERELRLSNVHRPKIKADLDNLAKSLLDALNGLLWDDDARIVHLELDKYYTEQPRTEIEVNERTNWNG